MDSEFSKKRALITGVLVLSFLGIPVTIYTALQQQDQRSRAVDPTPTPTPFTSTPTPTPLPTVNKCFECTEYPDVNTNTTWTYNGDGTVTIRATISKNFTDNSYGANSIGWPSAQRGHRFSDLVGSDHLNISIYDNNDAKIMEFKVDLLEESTNVSSGYETLCVSGGDGEMIVGNVSDVVSCRTSLSENFNTYGYVLTTDSPSTDENYTPNQTYPNWIYDVWYEATVNIAPFAAGGGVKEPIISSIHSSPSKKPAEDCPLAEVACLTTPTPSPTLTLTPTPTVTPTLTPTPDPSVTPTPPVCVDPDQVKNVKIECPNCSSEP